MIGLILATCITAHQCSWEVVNVDPSWVSVEQCSNDIPFFMMENNFPLNEHQALFCDELKKD